MPDVTGSGGDGQHARRASALARALACPSARTASASASVARKTAADRPLGHGRATRPAQRPPLGSPPTRQPADGFPWPAVNERMPRRCLATFDRGDRMSSATTLLEQFTDEDVDWLLDANEERHVRAGEMVIVAGEPVDCDLPRARGHPRGRGDPTTRGPSTSSVRATSSARCRSSNSSRRRSTVAALEASLLLVVPHGALRARAEADAGVRGAAVPRARACCCRAACGGRAATSPRAAPPSSPTTRERTVWEQVRPASDAAQGEAAGGQPGGPEERRRGAGRDRRRGAGDAPRAVRGHGRARSATTRRAASSSRSRSGCASSAS